MAWDLMAEDSGLITTIDERKTLTRLDSTAGDVRWNPIFFSREENDPGGRHVEQTRR